MTYLKFFISIISIFFAWANCFANVAGTKHDMYFLAKGTDPNVCSYCHIPHNAAGEKIWSTWANEARLTGSYTTIGNMCYTCHDGTATNKGQSTVFNTNLQQHKITFGQDCNMCHSVHDNTNGMFMNVPITQNFYCVSCHNAIVNAGGLGDYTYTATSKGHHPSYFSASTRRFRHNTGSPPTGATCSACHHEITQRASSYNSCGLCHEVHGGVNYSTINTSNPILRVDNTDSAFCASCHPVIVQNTNGGNKHPANLSSGGSWGKIDCMSCHIPHQSSQDTVFILRNKNVDSAYCLTCHETTSSSSGPKIGNGHPVNVPLENTPVDPAKTPVGNTIDDDGFYGIDYPANSSNVICESCHSAHRKGVASPLLRINNSGSALCLNCHQM